MIHWDWAWKEPWIIETELENGRQKERSPPETLTTVWLPLNSTPTYIVQRVGWCAFGHGVADAHADSHPRWAPFYACRVPGVFWLSQKILRSMVNYPNQQRSRKSLLWWYSGALRTTVLMCIVWYLYLWSHYFDIFNFHLIYLYISSKFIFIQRHRIHLTFLIIEIINLVSIKSISYPFPYHL